LDFATFTKDSTNEDTKQQQKDADGKNTSHHHTLQDGDLLLASGSQDKYIRIWRISAVADAPEQVAAEDATAQAGSEAALTQDMLKSLEEMYVFLGGFVTPCIAVEIKEEELKHTTVF
jgi:elongator complex protein 2